MNGRIRLFVAAVLLLAAGPAASKASEEDGPELLGPLAREEIEAAAPDWVEAEMLAQPDLETALLLESAFDGAEVIVFLGTWCSDSRRELPRLWRALDDIGADHPDQIHYIGVDRDKQEPSELLAGHELLYVPTFIVRRDGREVGRIVEVSPDGIERDLLALLSGTKQGLVTGKEELLVGSEGAREE